MLYRNTILSGAILMGLAVNQSEAQERWSGAYAGAGISAHEVTSNIKGSAVHRHRDENVTISFYGGYNFVRDSGFAWGPDVMLTGLHTPGSRSDGPLGTSDFKGSFLLSPRARIGYATDKAFFYGVLGLGLSDVGAKDANAGGTDWVLGGAYGLGVEVATSDLWSIRIEAMSYDLSVDDRAFNGVNSNVDSDIQQLTIGFTRKF